MVGQPKELGDLLSSDGGESGQQCTFGVGPVSAPVDPAQAVVSFAGGGLGTHIAHRMAARAQCENGRWRGPSLTPSRGRPSCSGAMAKKTRAGRR